MTNKNTAKQTKDTTLCMRLPATLKQRLSREAMDRGVTLSRHVRSILERNGG